MQGIGVRPVREDVTELSDRVLEEELAALGR
jgi:hypothetical protein